MSSSPPASCVVTGTFDNLGSSHIRFIDKASQCGDLHVLLYSDEVFRAKEGRDPKFPQAERLYFIRALRFVKQVTLVEELASPDALPAIEGLKPDCWALLEEELSPERARWCEARGIRVCPIAVGKDEPFAPLPTAIDAAPSAPGRKKVMVTGCFDWFHSGHVRFFEECSQLGDLYVVLGSDANVRLLKGEGHPLFSERERGYVVQSIRHVKQALVSTGTGWVDAEPEIHRIQPDMYAVNEDGDKPDKVEFCKRMGLEYVVLKRTPAPGLPRRQSTDLRGF